MTKRKVEVFTAGCPFCEETVRLVKKLSCPSCEVIVYDLHKQGMDLAKKYGVSAVPAVVVDGKIAVTGKASEADLRAVGIGSPL